MTVELKKYIENKIKKTVNEGVRLSLVDPNTNKFIKTLSLDRTYSEAEKEVETLNKRLSTSQKNKGLYWTVTTIGESVNEALWPKSKLSDRFQFLLAGELKKHFRGVWYSMGYDLYHDYNRVLTINPDKDSVTSIINQLKSKIKESVNESLNEGLGDSIKKIRNLAIKMAKQNFNQAIPHINMGNITPNTKFDGDAALNVATKTLSTQSQIDEGMRDTINKLAAKLYTGTTILSLISGVVALEGWSEYINASFTKWYYTNIQKLAEPEVMKVMQDMQSANQSVGSIHGKFGMYAFFIFFTIAIISLAVFKVTKHKSKSVNESKGKPKFKTGQEVNYIPKLSGLSPTKKLKISNVVYKDGDELTPAGWYYSFAGTNLTSSEKDIKLVESANEEEQLDEKLITFSNRAPYGQVVFMAGGAGCFSSDTKVKTKSGYKLIKDIVIGDEVYSYNETTKQQELKVVLDVYSYKIDELPENQKMLELEFDNGVKIQCTENHEFYIDGDWVMAKDIELGSDCNMKLISKTVINYNSNVYDFQVDGNHNYYVSDSDILVHNSGKGFAISNFIDSAGFKVRDVDEMKKQVAILDKVGKFSIQEWYSKYSKNLKEKELAHVNHVIEKNNLKNKTIYAIASDLKNPDNVAALHYIVDAMGMKEKWLANMLAGKTNPATLPNIIFDITAKNIKSVVEVLPSLITAGYDPRNIHLIWVLTNYDIAVKNNMGRERIVPSDILLQTHEGAATTIWSMLTGVLPSEINGRVDVILNNKENTVVFKDDKGNPIKIQLKGKSEPQIVVKGFLALPIKKQGGGIVPENQWKSILWNWVVTNIPATLKTDDGKIIAPEKKLS